MKIKVLTPGGNIGIHEVDTFTVKDGGHLFMYREDLCVAVIPPGRWDSVWRKDYEISQTDGGDNGA